MRLQFRDSYTTCTACEETHVGGYVLTVGTLTFALCPKCLKLLFRILRREERKAEARA